MKVMNAMEVIIAEALTEYWPSIKMTCKCEKCRADVFALVLNMVPPRYFSKEMGFAYVKAQYFEKQMKTNLLVKIAEATSKVSDHPQCGQVIKN
ncbi:late competence development ComFB family protein [Bacillus timonensis]|nr:late competence development ComFB family protein [Bacillus timonensis]